MSEIIDFAAVTACGECCTGCVRKAAGSCRGCIESDGHCEEWTQSGGCPIHRCAREHHVPFCGVCDNFPCNWLVNKVTWNPNLVAHLTALADLYRKRSEHHAADTVV